MYLRAVLLLGLTILPLFFQNTNGDEVKKKRVIIKVPKRIQHIYHHHTKKIHIRKPKPKPIVHLVEEIDPIHKEWIAIHSKFPIPKYKKPGRSKHKLRQNSWRSEPSENEYDFDNEEEYDDDYKEASYNKEYVWKGRGNEGREHSRGKWNNERGKRHKERGYNSEREELHPRGQWKDETRTRQNRANLEKSRRPQNGNKQKGKSTRNSGKPRRPIDKGFLNYDEYVEVADNHSVWPEKKEHISWSLNGKVSQSAINDIQPDYSHSINYNANSWTSDKNYKSDTNNGQQMPDIPVVPPPQFNLQLAGLAAQQYIPLQFEGHQKKIQQGAKKEVRINSLRSADPLSYTHHIGHTESGGATSFQFVQFGDTNRPGVNGKSLI